MQTTLYACDLCRKETRDAKDMYAPRDKKMLSVVYVLDFLRQRYTVQDVCVQCFDKFNEMLNEDYKTLTGRK
jgi:hypothetical protein